MKPDSPKVTGDQSLAALSPRHHSWRIECDHPLFTRDKQITQILDRLLPRESTIAAVLAEIEKPREGCGAQLSVVPNFTDETGVDFSPQGLRQIVEVDHVDVPGNDPCSGGTSMPTSCRSLPMSEPESISTNTGFSETRSR